MSLGSPVRRFACLTFLLAGASLATAGAASAATVAVDSGVLTYNADAAHTNIIAIDQGNPSGTPNDTVTITRDQNSFGSTTGDDDPMVPGTNCTDTTGGGGGDQVVTCTGVTSVVTNLGDRDDLALADGAFFGGSGLITIPITINAGDGNDGLAGGQADDTLNGENGNDGNFGRFDGNGGADHLNGGAGDDSNMDGGQGNDVIDGGAGDDTVFDSGTPTTPAPATPGPNDTSNDTITGGDGQDSLNGGAGDDSIDGGDGSDVLLVGGIGTDTVNGGNGDDFVQATEDHVADTYNGGAGNDTIDYSTYGGDVGANLAGGPAGSGGENDTLGADFENLNGGAGNDLLAGNGLDNVINGNSGADTIAAGAGNDTLLGGSGNDVLGGGDGRDTLQGGDGNDVLNGENGDDDLQGDAGDDALNGGAGNDTADYTERNGLFAPAQNVTVTLDGVANDGASGEADNADADHQVENVLTGSGDDTIVGNALVNFIDSGPGNDVISAQDGTFLTDIVSCGTGYDTAAADPLDAVETSGPDRCENFPPPTITRAKSSVSIKVTPKRDRRKPFRYTTSGTAHIGAVPAQQGCGSAAFVIVQIKAGHNTISARKAKLSKTCKYKSTVSFGLPKRFRGKSLLRVQAKFSGNRFLLPSNSKVKKVRAG